LKKLDTILLEEVLTFNDPQLSDQNCLKINEEKRKNDLNINFQ